MISPSFIRVGKRSLQLMTALLVYATSPTTAAAAAHTPLSLADGSHIRLDFLDGRVDVMQVLHVHNGSESNYDPEEGFSLMLPRYATDIRSDHGLLVEASSESVSILGSFPPGMNLVRLRFSLPLHRGRLDYHQDLRRGPETMYVILPSIPGIEVAGDEIIRVAQRQAEEISLLVIDVDTSSGHLSFSLEGLPRTKETGRWIALGLAGGILMVGLVLGLTGSLPRNLDRERALAEKSKLLDELEQLEIDKKEGLIDDMDYATDREDLMARLAWILRELEEPSGD